MVIVCLIFDYVILKVMRDKVMLNGKLNVVNIKSFLVVKGNMWVKICFCWLYVEINNIILIFKWFINKYGFYIENVV